MKRLRSPPSPCHPLTVSLCHASVLAKSRHQSRLPLRGGLPVGWRSGNRWSRSGRFRFEFLRSRILRRSRSRWASNWSRWLSRHRLHPGSVAERLNPIRNVRRLMVMDRRVAIVPTPVIATMPVTHMPLRRHGRLRQPMRSRLPIRNLLVRVAELRRVCRRVDLWVAAVLACGGRAGPMPLLRPVTIVGHSATDDWHLRRNIPAVVRRQDVVVAAQRPLHNRRQAAIVAAAMAARAAVPRTGITLLRTWRTRFVRTAARCRGQG